MKYTNLKTSLIYGDIKVVQVICLNQTDFLSEEEKKDWQEALEQAEAGKRGDWFKDKLKAKQVDGLFECKKCHSKKTTFY